MMPWFSNQANLERGYLEERESGVGSWVSELRIFDCRSAISDSRLYGLATEIVPMFVLPPAATEILRLSAMPGDAMR